MVFPAWKQSGGLWVGEETVMNQGRANREQRSQAEAVPSARLSAKGRGVGVGSMIAGGIYFFRV